MPSSRKPIRPKCVFEQDYKSNGSLGRYEARLVCTGYRQKYGINHEESFSPVVRPESIRLLIAIAIHLDADIHQIDSALIKSEFTRKKTDYGVYTKENIANIGLQSHYMLMI